MILVSDGNGRARIYQAECRARTVFKLDFEFSLGLVNGSYFAAWRYFRSTGCLYLHARLIVEQNQNAAWLDRCDLDCSAGENFRKFLVSWHSLLACSTCWGISAIKCIRFRHELALFSFTVETRTGIRALARILN
jgi:hypothetical protein